MLFRSTNTAGSLVSFREAVLNPLPQGGGLFVPEKAADIRQLFLYMNEDTPFLDLVTAALPSLLEGELNPLSASRVAQNAWAAGSGNFGPGLIRLDDNYSLLNIYDDFGNAFFAALLEELQGEVSGTLAGTINPGRLLPQIFYYLYAFIKIKKLITGGLAFSLLCGDFGNLIAGLYAWKFGMPVNCFVAAANSDNSLGDLFKGGAVDVSVPSNLSRLASFFQEAPAVMRNMLFPASIDDELALTAIDKVWNNYNIRIDSNTAAAFAAAEQTSASRGWKDDIHTIILAAIPANCS